VAAQLTPMPDGRLKLAFAIPAAEQSGHDHARKTGAKFAPLPYADMFFDDIKTLYDLEAPDSHTIRVDQSYSDFRKGEKAKLDSLAYLPLQDFES